MHAIIIEKLISNDKINGKVFSVGLTLNKKKKNSSELI